MKIKIVKCSNDKLWYSSLNLPIEFEVKESSNSTYEIIEETSDMASFVIGKQLFKDDCEYIEDVVGENKLNMIKPTKISEGKLFYEMDWEFIEGMAQRMKLNKQNGKYDVFGWRDNGVDIDQMNQALIRHLMAILKGELQDDDQKYSHYYALACNSMLIINQLKKNAETK